jgi:hypothetical protein
MEAEVALHGGTPWAWHNHLCRIHDKHDIDTPRARTAVEQQLHAAAADVLLAVPRY